jgi:hypothetical protein
MFAYQIRSRRLWRGQDDPNTLVIEETFDSPERRSGFGRTLRSRLPSSVRIEYLDEVGSGGH